MTTSYRSLKIQLPNKLQKAKNGFILKFSPEYSGRKGEFNDTNHYFFHVLVKVLFFKMK